MISEEEEQIVAMDWLRLQHPEVAECTWHTANERKCSYYRGYRLKRLGVLKGVSDIFMAWPIGKYHGAFIEVKSKKGRATPEQLEFLDRMFKKGYYTKLAYGADQVINTMKDYLENRC